MDYNENTLAYCAYCKCAMDVTDVAPFTNVQCPKCAAENRIKTDIGAYELTKRQGSGGMSHVFQAIDKSLGRTVAIKILNEHYSRDAKRIQQFEQEATITAALSHPHIVRVFTVGQAYERYYIAMEFVGGDSLEQKMNVRGALPELEVLEWAIQITEGLHAANKAHLLHRDIKPGNILFDAQGHIKIVDFGLALVTQGGKASAKEIWATPYYVPPETLEGSEEDFRADMYALGASLAHALSGKVPFESESKSTKVLLKLKLDLASLKDLAPWLHPETCKIIDKAMAFDPDERYHSYPEFLKALRYAFAVVKNPAKYTTAPLAAAPPATKGKKVFYGVATALIAATAGTAMYFKSTPKNIDPAPAIAALDGIEATISNSSQRRYTHLAEPARKHLRAKEYGKAADAFSQLFQNPDASSDIRNWAALNAVLCHFTNGDQAAAKTAISRLHQHSVQAQNMSPATRNMLSELMTQLSSDTSLNDSSIKVQNPAVKCMLQMLYAHHDWQLGDFNNAVAQFETINPNEIPNESEELQLATSLIPTYLDDLRHLEGHMGKPLPRTLNDISSRIAELEHAAATAQTAGVVPDIYKRLIADVKSQEVALLNQRTQELSETSASAQEQRAMSQTWQDFTDDIYALINADQFSKAYDLLRVQQPENEQQRHYIEQMSYLCDHAAGYLHSLADNIPKQETFVTIRFRHSNAKLDRIAGATPDGLIISNSDGSKRTSLLWADVHPSSILDLHKFTIAESLSSFEHNFRLNQAACYAWLSGQYDKALQAASVIGKSDPMYLEPWKKIVELAH